MYWFACCGVLVLYAVILLIAVLRHRLRAPIVTGAGCDVAITGGAFPDFSRSDLYVEDGEPFILTYTGYPPLEEDPDDLQS